MNALTGLGAGGVRAGTTAVFARTPVEVEAVIGGRAVRLVVVGWRVECRPNPTPSEGKECVPAALVLETAERT